MKSPDALEKRNAAEAEEAGFRIEIFYSPHSSPEDKEGLEKALEGADIYIPECPSWRPQDRLFWQKIADGRLSPRDLGSQWTAEHPELNTIAGSGLHILLIDLPEGHHLIEKDKESLNGLEHCLKDFSHGAFDQALINFILYSKKFAEVQRQREHFMLERLQEEMSRIKRMDPPSQGKDPLKVVVSLGNAHTDLYREFQKAGIPVKRTMHTPVLTFPHDIETFRRNAMGRFDSLPLEEQKTLAARGLLTYVVGEYFAVSPKTEKNGRLLRKAIEKLSFEDIREISLKKIPPENLPAYLEEKVGLPGSGFAADRQLGKDPRFQGPYSKT